jgi:hypothetical protein
MQNGPIQKSRSACCPMAGMLARSALFVLFAAMIALAALPAPGDGKQVRAAQAKPEPVAPVDPDEAARLRLPGNEFFAGVKDKRPLATIADNYWEYLACAYVFNHVNKFSAETLAKHARTGAGYADLINEDRGELLRQLVHVYGRLVRLIQRDAGDFINDPKIKNVYEGWIYHEHEAQHPVVVVFTELPEGVEVSERLNVPVSFDGYYFKLLGFKSPERDPKGRELWRVAPLLIGRKLNATEKIEPPPVDPDALSYQQVQLPKGVKYSAIADTERLADPKKNPLEWDAYVKIIAHASQVPHSALKARHRAGISYAALTSTDDDRGSFYRQLLLIRGRLFDLRKVALGEAYKSANLKELYEGWMYQDGDVSAPVRVVLTGLPDGFTLGESVNEFIDFDGYYFKLATFTGEQMAGQPAPRYAPILIGRSFRVIDTIPRAVNPNLSEADQVALKDHELFSQVRDKRPIASYSENMFEYLAYTSIFEKIMQFTPEVLARNSRRDVVYADLINEVREREYLRKLLHVEGRLVRVRRRDAKDFLRIPNLEHYYEGWILFENEPKHLVVVAFTEIPEGIETGERVNYQVSVDGYYFKLMGYMSDEKVDGKNIWRVAPLLVARKPTVIPDPREQYSWSGFVPLVIGLIGVVALAALILTLWFRRGDRRTRRMLRDTMLAANPFDDEPPPPVRPGTAWNQLDDPLSPRSS